MGIEPSEEEKFKARGRGRLMTNELIYSLVVVVVEGNRELI